MLDRMLPNRYAVVMLCWPTTPLWDRLRPAFEKETSSILFVWAVRVGGMSGRHQVSKRRLQRCVFVSLLLNFNRNSVHFYLKSVILHRKKDGPLQLIWKQHLYRSLNHLAVQVLLHPQSAVKIANKTTYSRRSNKWKRGFFGNPKRCFNLQRSHFSFAKTCTYRYNRSGIFRKFFS